MSRPSCYYFLLLEMQVILQNTSRDQLFLQVCQPALKSLQLVFCFLGSLQGFLVKLGLVSQLFNKLRDLGFKLGDHLETKTQNKDKPCFRCNKVLKSSAQTPKIQLFITPTFRFFVTIKFKKQVIDSCYLPLLEINLHSLSSKIFLIGIFNFYIIP